MDTTQQKIDELAGQIAALQEQITEISALAVSGFYPGPISMTLWRRRKTDDCRLYCEGGHVVEGL